MQASTRGRMFLAFALIVASTILSGCRDSAMVSSLPPMSMADDEQETLPGPEFDVLPMGEQAIRIKATIGPTLSDQGAEVEIELEPEQWDGLRELLLPAEAETEPINWIELGKVQVWMENRFAELRFYAAGDPPAFSVETTVPPQRVYYRASKDVRDELEAYIRKLCEE